MSKLRGKALAAKVVPLYESGMNPADIAGQVGCSHPTVYAVLKREGVEYKRDNYRKFVPEAISYSEVDPIWAAEFRGFFYGDGSAAIYKSEDRNYPNYTPKLMITLRLDSKPLLLDIQNHLGGTVDETGSFTSSFGYKSNPTTRWYTQSYSNIFAIIRDVLLPDARLPAPKRDQIELLYEAVQARFGMPYQMGAEARAVLHDYHIRLKDLKRF